jgi:dihydrofolate synthase/folylpolyglutamate synthase
MLSRSIETYDDAVAYLDAHVGLGVRPGLERIRHLLELMGDPHLAYPVVHIAGTNGKTSTARMVSSLVAAHGLVVGTFTSPHLEAVEERFTVSGEVASREDFTQAIADVAPFAQVLESQTGEGPTYFELTVAAAFAYFAERAVDAAVVEVGLGGRLDATNVVEPAVAVVTSVGLDHTEYLGDTLSQIAREKLGIVKPDSVLVTGVLPDEIGAIAAARAEEVGVERRAAGVDFDVEEASLAVGGWFATLRGVYDTYADVFLPLHGRHQVQNLAVATAATEELFGRALDAEAVREGTADIQSPGRIEVAGHSPLVVLDGAHNESSMAVLAATLEDEFPDLEWTVVFGALGDKDVEQMLGLLEPFIGHLILTAADSPRAIPPEVLAADVARSLPDIERVEVVPQVPHAVAHALSGVDADGAVLITGSLYVVGEARPMVMAAH